MSRENFRFKSGVWYVLLIALVSVLLFGRATAAPMRYAPKADAKFAYKVEIIAELPGRVDTSSGTISYEVTSSGEIVKFDYYNGLGN